MSTENFTKHTHKNPIQKFLIFLFYQFLFQKLQGIKPDKILDAGCGEGITLAKLQKAGIGKKLVGLEYLGEAIKISKKEFPQLDIRKGTIYSMPFKDNSFDLVICTEVLEHLDDPQKALKEAVRVSSKYCLLSVPNEPFFMLAQLIRGKNWSRLGNDIEHINHWTFWGFKKFVSTQLEIQSVSIPFFWTIILASKNN